LQHLSGEQRQILFHEFKSLLLAQDHRLFWVLKPKKL